MPEWLLKKDDYIPLKDKNAFINKSIFSILNIISRFRKQTEYKNKKVEINALMKFITTMLLILFLSLTKNFMFVILVNVGLLVIINFLSIDEIKYVIKMGFIVAIFTFIILLPSVFMGYGNNILMITLKVFASVSFVNILAVTTQWNELIAALKIFHVPDIFIFVMDITIKYIIVLGEFALNMVYSLKLRSVGKSSSKNASLAGVIGTMFLKSKEMSEEMYGAMECRGFTGEYKNYKKFKFKLMDYICILFDIIFVLIYFILR